MSTPQVTVTQNSFIVEVAPANFVVEVALASFIVTPGTSSFIVEVGDEDPTVVEVTQPSLTVVSDPNVSVVEVGTPSTVVVNQPRVDVVEVAKQGLNAEDLSMNFRKLTDLEEDTPVVGQLTIYIGWASPGSGSTSSASWKIQKLVLNDEDDIISSGFAGSALFDQIWDNRVSLTYS